MNNRELLIEIHKQILRDDAVMSVEWGLRVCDIYKSFPMPSIRQREVEGQIFGLALSTALIYGEFVRKVLHPDIKVIGSSKSISINLEKLNMNVAEIREYLNKIFWDNEQLFDDLSEKNTLTIECMWEFIKENNRIIHESLYYHFKERLKVGDPIHTIYQSLLDPNVLMEGRVSEHHFNERLDYHNEVKGYKFVSGQFSRIT